MTTDPRFMDAKVLKEYIESFPKTSVCERRIIEKLNELLRIKQLEEERNDGNQFKIS
jgi:hypothetical protein